MWSLDDDRERVRGAARIDKGLLGEDKLRVLFGALPAADVPGAAVELGVYRGERRGGFAWPCQSETLFCTTPSAASTKATSSELVTTVLRSADFMKALIESVETSNEADISAHVETLQRFRSGAPLEMSSTASTSATPRASQPAAAPLSEAAREFVTECNENLDQMDQDLLALEQSPTSDNLLRRVFRTMHTIKGGAGFLGLGSLERLAHAAETLLSKLRDGECALTADLTSALLATVDKCRERLRLLEANGFDGDDLDLQPIIQKLLSASQQESVTDMKSEPIEVTPELPIGEILLRQGQVSPQDLESALMAQAAGDPRHVGEILVQEGVAKSDDVVAALKAQSDSRGNSVSDGNIRVDVGLLDKLMTRVGELVLARNQIVQYTSRLGDANFISTAQRLNLITTELQESVMKTRMQPIGNVWAKFPRVVRDLSSQLGKQVRIEMEGKETELDKTIVEAIKDPLTHLVRNSVDHGIESPEARRPGRQAG